MAFSQYDIYLVVPQLIIALFLDFAVIIVVTIVARLVHNGKVQLVGAAGTAIVLLTVAVLLIDPTFKKSWARVTDPYIQGTAGKTAYVLSIGAAGLLAWAIYIGLLLYATGIAHRLVWSRYPNLTLLGLLIEVFKALTQRRAILDFTLKARISNLLEGAARVMKDDIPRAVSLPDPQARSILQERCECAAASLRIMQVSVALAENDTLEELKQAIKLFISAIATGNYSNLPGTSPTPSREMRVNRFVQLGKTTIVALIPFACLVITHYAGLPLSSRFNNWAIVISLLWAALTFVSFLDPLYKSRIEEVQSIIPFIGKSQK
jgi:heme exporter protein D